MTSALEDQLNQIGSLLYEKGEAFDIGCTTEKYPEIFEHWLKKTSTKRVRAVKDWCWWDLRIPEGVELPPGIKPTLLYSQYILNSSDGKYKEGSWVRSTALIELHDDYVFETRNTFYILVGSGTRKTVEPEQAISIF